MTPGAKQASEEVFHTSHSKMPRRLLETMFRSVVTATAGMLPHMLPLHTEV